MPDTKEGALCVATPFEGDGKIKIQWFDGLSKKYPQMQLTIDIREEEKGKVGAFAINRSGTILATAATNDSIVSLWDTTNGNEIASVRVAGG